MAGKGSGFEGGRRWRHSSTAASSSASSAVSSRFFAARGIGTRKPDAVWSICTVAGGKGIADRKKADGNRTDRRTDNRLPSAGDDLDRVAPPDLGNSLAASPPLLASAALLREVFTAFPVEVCRQMTPFLLTTRSFESRSKSARTAPFIFNIRLPSCFILPSLAAHDLTVLVLFSFLCTATPSLPRACISSEPETILF